MSVHFNVRGHHGVGLLHWRKHYYALWPETMVKKKNVLMDFFLRNAQLSLHNTSIDGLESCGLLVDYCDFFISCLDSHTDGTHSLQRVHW